MSATETPAPAPAHADIERVAPVRVAAGGILMGLANIVPGVSGGTMILALGLYDTFIGAVAQLTRLRFTRQLVLFCAIFGSGLVVALVAGAGGAVKLVGEHRSIMYALFMGLTLGGVPELVGLCRPARPSVWISGGVGLAVMAVLAFVLKSVPVPANPVTYFLIGALAASSMILPGISGSTILLIFGFYEGVIGSLSAEALRSDPVASALVIGPVGVGAVLGIVLLSNVLKACLARYPLPSHGLLMGLLVGSLLVILPFQEPVHPELAARAQRKAITALVVQGASLEDVNAEFGVGYDADDEARIRAEYGSLGAGELKLRGDRLQYFRPGAAQLGTWALFLALGFGVTQLIGRLGSRSE